MTETRPVDPVSHHVARVEAAHSRIDGLSERVSRLELSDAVAIERDKHIQVSLEKIEGSIAKVEGSISKVAWLVMTGLIGGNVAFVIRGGLHIGG